MIELSHVYKTYNGRQHALKNIDLKIQKGEFVFLTGPSGAGKSTLFKLISAFDRATSGDVQVNGKSLNKIKTDEIPFFRRQIGVVFQDFKLLKDRTIFENVSLPLVVKNEKSSMVERKVNDILELVGLGHKHDDYPDFLSGGEQQRVAIARAIVHQPALLIADEPTGNLDPKMGSEIMDIFEKVAAQGTTLFLATHDHDMVERRRKRTVHIENGVLSGELR